MNPIALLMDCNNIACRASFVAPHESIENMDFSIMDNMLNSKKRMLTHDGYDDIRTCYVFDEPSCDYIDFKPHINRRKLIGEYKGTRPSCTDDNAVYERDCWIQGWMQQLFSQHENVVSYPGAEADDYLAYIAQSISEDGINSISTCIWSADKDLLQCVDDERRIMAIRSHRGERKETIFHEAEVLSEKHVPARKIRMQLALQGDVADNYKGIRGYGGKKGLEIINKSDNIESLLQLFPDDHDQIMRNWNLAGVGAEYLDDNAINRAKESVAIITGPEF